MAMEGEIERDFLVDLCCYFVCARTQLIHRLAELIPFCCIAAYGKWMPLSRINGRIN